MENIDSVGSRIKSNYDDIVRKAEIAANKVNRNINDILVLAVSKTQNSEILNAAYSKGIHIFGENYAQEFRDKNKELNDIYKINPVWHFIGHLQTNKVKYLFPFVSMIHTVDSLEIANEIAKQAKKYNMNINVLIQVNTSGEPQKSGVAPEMLEQIIDTVLPIENITINGLMTIGSFAENESISRKEFSLLFNLREKVKITYKECDFKHLSMGMTHDFDLAIEEGSTIVRVGTAVFGARDYSK